MNLTKVTAQNTFKNLDISQPTVYVYSEKDYNALLGTKAINPSQGGKPFGTYVLVNEGETVDADGILVKGGFEFQEWVPVEGCEGLVSALWKGPAPERLKAIYLNGANGSDENTGADAANAVKTLTKALELAKANETKQVKVCGVVHVTDSVTLDDSLVFTRGLSYNTSGAIFCVTGEGTLPLKDVTLDSNKDNVNYGCTIVFVELVGLSQGAKLNIEEGALLENNADSAVRTNFSEKDSGIVAFGNSKVTLDGAVITGSEAGTMGGELTSREPQAAVTDNYAKLKLSETPNISGKVYLDNFCCGNIKVTAAADFAPQTSMNNKGTVTKAPTCRENGVMTYTCNSCGKTVTKTEEIESKGHTIPGRAATCTATGLTAGSRCSVCNKIVDAQETTPALGHSFSQVYASDENGHWHTCARCGAASETQAHDAVTAPAVSPTYSSCRPDQGKPLRGLRLCHHSSAGDSSTGWRRFLWTAQPSHRDDHRARCASGEHAAFHGCFPGQLVP